MENTRLINFSKGINEALRNASVDPQILNAFQQLCNWIEKEFDHQNSAGSLGRATTGPVIILASPAGTAAIGLNKGEQAVYPGGTRITFEIPFGNNRYVMIANCFNYTTGVWNQVHADIRDKDQYGITVDPDENATFAYHAIAY